MLGGPRLVLFAFLLAMMSSLITSLPHNDFLDQEDISFREKSEGWRDSWDEKEEDAEEGEYEEEENEEEKNEEEEFEFEFERKAKPPPGFMIDFEDQQHMEYCTQDSNTLSKFSRDNTYHKNGDYALKWNWPKRVIAETRKVELILNLTKQDATRDETEVKKGGIKFWMYRGKNQVPTKMRILFGGDDRSGKSAESTETVINLNFQGWRAVWISYGEFPKGQFGLKTIKYVTFNIESKTPGSLYLDMIQFVKKVEHQTRDLVLPEIGQPREESDKPRLPSPEQFWQTFLYWYQKGAPKRLGNKYAGIRAKNITELLEIENRIENWYLNKTESIVSLENYILGSETTKRYDFQGAKQKRWQELTKMIKMAYQFYINIDFNSSLPTLFSEASSFGVRNINMHKNVMSKFGFVFHKILLPLSIEFNFRSRDKMKSDLNATYCEELESERWTPENYLVNHTLAFKFAGEIYNTRKEFEKIVKAEPLTTPLNCSLVLEKLDDFRFSQIKHLLEYVQEQGFAEGSGLGSSNHEMNRAGSGFMHSMFLIRNALREKAPDLLARLIGAMKWYNDFNEIYQKDDEYVYDGSTADRIQTIFLYRLFIIIIDNACSDKQLENMEYFITWAKHALRINKGLGGLIKPDYTTFHHKTFYGSAYAPHALHSAALIQFFLAGTRFSLLPETKDNIRKALEVFHIVAVKYSTPNGICGRFPGYTKAVLAEHVPAYAYISYNHSHTSTDHVGIPNRPEMFLMMFYPTIKSFNDYLFQGRIPSRIYYWNTLGSLGVMRTVLSSAPDIIKVQAAPPSGHWSKNFAAMSIHRRQGWSVATKGFNRFVFDFEATKKENVYGVFQSHGSLQISNSEDALKTYDVENGWDWTMVPGATTVQMPLDEMILTKTRNYNYKGKLAGSVSLIGLSNNPRYANGVFGMSFEHPNYKTKLGTSFLKTPFQSKNLSFSMMN